MDTWVEAVRVELDLDTPVDVPAILDVAKVAAHTVERPAAPITTYLLGVAVGRGMDAREAARRIDSLATDWAQAPGA